MALVCRLWRISRSKKPLNKKKMNNATVLILDDDPDLRKLLCYQINKAGFKIFEADTAQHALDILNKESVDVVLSDVFLPDGNGVDLTKVIKAAYPTCEVVVITGEGRIEDGVKAIKNGAFDYLVKSEDTEKLISLLTQAAESVLVKKRIQELEKEVDDKLHSNEDIIAQNAEQIEKATLIIKAIHSPLRQRIMQLIFAHGRITVTEIYTTLNLEQSIASQHLGILKSANLVHSTREGKKVFYSANYTGIEKIIVFVQQLLSGKER